MEFKLTFYAVIVIGMMITAVGVIINDMGVEYGSGVTSDLGIYDKVGEATDYIEGYQGNINPQSGEANTDPEQITYRGAYGIIAGIFKPFTMLSSMLDSLFERFGIPNYVKQGLLSMMIAAVVFTLVAIIFRTTKPNV